MHWIATPGQCEEYQISCQECWRISDAKVTCLRCQPVQKQQPSHWLMASPSESFVVCVRRGKMTYNVTCIRHLIHGIYHVTCVCMILWGSHTCNVSISGWLKCGQLLLPKRIFNWRRGVDPDLRLGIERNLPGFVQGRSDQKRISVRKSCTPDRDLICARKEWSEADFG